MWSIKRTETFLRALKEHRRNKQLLIELEKKVMRLSEDPLNVGGILSGKLHGKRSTRLTKKFRLVFEIDERSRVIYLVALDHRETVYK